MPGGNRSRCGGTAGRRLSGRLEETHRLRRETAVLRRPHQTIDVVWKAPVLHLDVAVHRDHDLAVLAGRVVRIADAAGIDEVAPVHDAVVRTVGVTEDDDVRVGRIPHLTEVVRVAALPRAGGGVDGVGVHPDRARVPRLEAPLERQVAEVAPRLALGVRDRPAVRQLLQPPPLAVAAVAAELFRLRRHALVDVAAHTRDLLGLQEGDRLFGKRREADQIPRVAEHVVTLGPALPERHLEGGEIPMDVTQRDDLHDGCDARPGALGSAGGGRYQNCGAPFNRGAPGSFRSARGGPQRGAAHTRSRRALRALLARMARLEIASPRCVPPCTSEIRHCYWSQVAPLFCLRTRTGFSATAEAPGRGLSQILAEGVWR